MARKKRSEVFVPSEVAIVHTICKVVRRCMLMGYDKVTNKNYDHRKDWIENEFKRLASYFAIDVLAFSILSNHVHQILRSRPDIVETWSDREAARRWLTLCPTVAQDKESVRNRKQAAKAKKAKLQKPTTENAENGLAAPAGATTDTALPFAVEPSEAAINMIVNNPKKLQAIRLQLSDISWWMRLLCQRIAQWANAEEGGDEGKFWRGRFKGIRLMDEASILACTAYVDLNVIRAALAETLEGSDYTSAQRRIQELQAQAAAIEQAAAAAADEAGGVVEVVGTNEVAGLSEPGQLGQSGQLVGVAASAVSAALAAGKAKTREQADVPPPDPAFRIEEPILLPLHQWLAPIELKQGLDVFGSDQLTRKGFLMMTRTEYIELLEWTARQIVPGKRGATPEDTPPILQRLNISPEIWCILATSFDSLFGVAAGSPTTLDKTPGPTARPFRMRGATRELLADVQTAS
jgi:hypothetical protein